MQKEAEKIISEIRRIRSICQRAIRREERKLIKQKGELDDANKWLWYQQIGDSLLALPQVGEKGNKEREIQNVHTNLTEPVPLNPKLTIKKNAELFYKRSRKARRGHEIAEKKVELTEKSIKKLISFYELIEGTFRSIETEENPEEKLSELNLKAQDIGLIPNVSSQKEGNKESTPFNRFYFNDWELYVGKHASQNDELTTRFAKPRDIWLHVAAHAGSHVIIRRPKGKEWPPKDVLHKAGMLAVWYSKARHTSYAEVHVTEARYVRKPRKAPPGEVQITNYKTIRVAPMSPKELFSQNRDSNI